MHLGKPMRVADAGTGEVGSFRRDDLAGIVLTAADAPAGTGYAQDLSGFQDLDAFASDAQERRTCRRRLRARPLRCSGPRGGRARVRGNCRSMPRSHGRSPGCSNLGWRGPRLRAVRQDLRTRQFDRSEDLPPPGLGQESFALEGTSGGSHLVIYVWRDDNLIRGHVRGRGVGRRRRRALAALVRARTDR